MWTARRRNDAKWSTEVGVPELELEDEANLHQGGGDESHSKPPS